MPEVRLGGKLCLTRHPKYAPGQGQATSYLNPIGPQPGVGYVWMLAADAQTLDFEQPQSLSIDATETIVIPRLYIDSAIAASGLSPGDENRAYFLTLRDSRFLLDRLTDVNLAINCRARPAPTDSTAAVDPMEFYADTLLAGAPYSWSEAVSTLWSLCPPTLVGAFPGLPYQPAGVPQNLRFVGVSAWHALHDLLGRVQMTTAYDAANDSFSIVDLSVVQPSLSAVGNYANRLLNDRFPGGSTKARVPATVRIYFQKQAQHFGTEPDTPRVANWQFENAQYWQDVPTGAAAEPGTVVALHDDAPALVDFNGLVLNEIELLARANDRAAQWTSAKILEIARGSLLIQGVAAPLAVPGSQVSSVLLRNFGDGWATELALTPNRVQGSGFRVQEEKDGNFAAPNLARRTWPAWPRVSQWVKIANSTPDANGLCQASVVRANPALNFSKSGAGAAYTTVESCYVAGANGESFTSGRVYPARMNGVAFSAGGWLPLYIAQPATSPMLVQMQADCPYGESAQAVQISVPQGEAQGDEAAGDPPAEFTVFNKLHGLLRKNSIVWTDNDGDGWYSVTALANCFLARVVAGQASATTGYCAVDGPIDCTLVDEAGGNLSETDVTISAVPVYAPVIDNELVFVEFVWPESESMAGKWIVVRGELDGGFMAQTQSGSSNVASGGTAAVNPQPQFLGADTKITAAQNVQAQFALGGVSGLKMLWVNRNRGGFFVTAAQC